MLFDKEAVKAMIPHREPMLLVDRIDKMSDRFVKGGLRLTGEEPFFEGHFPGMPIMPGVMIIETALQLGACLIHQRKELRGKCPLVTRFGSDILIGFPVSPPCDLTTEFELTALYRGHNGEGRFRVSLDGLTVAEGSVGFMLISDGSLPRMAAIIKARTSRRQAAAVVS